MQTFIRSRLFYRIAESIVPALTWIIITFPLWFSPFHPAIVAYFILAFILYFLYKSIRTMYYAVISYTLINQAGKIDWFNRLTKIPLHSKIHHFFVITNYKESLDKMTRTIEYIQKQKYTKKNISIVLAMEKREGQEAYERSRILTEKFAHSFGGFETVYHTLQEGEIVGKASNESYAARHIAQKIKSQNIDPKDVLITICDADSLLPDEYLAYTTTAFLEDKNRIYHFYCAPVLLYNNFWKLPLPIRVQATLSSILRLSFLSQKNHLIQISTYTVNLWLLQEVDFWDVDIIPEDWHIWLQTFFKFGSSVQTIPIYLPISADATLGTTLFKTFKNRYEQEKRWSWGASDIPYAIIRFFDTPHVSFMLKIRKIFQIAETHLLWPTTFFVLTISASIPALINPSFKRTVMGLLLPKLSSFILTISSSFLFIFLYFDHKMRSRLNIKTKATQLPILFIQWYLLPIISFFLSSLPALEAHTRMLLGKKLEYKVTEKV